MKIIEMIKGVDGTYREGKAEPKQAILRYNKPRASTFPRKNKYRQRQNLVERVAQELNDTLEEIGMKALNELKRGFFDD